MSFIKYRSQCYLQLAANLRKILWKSVLSIHLHIYLIYRIEGGFISKEWLSNYVICVFLNFEKDISFEMNRQLCNAKYE